MSNQRPTTTAERAAAAMRAQQTAERRRRLVVVGAVVAVLVIIGGLTWFAISRGDTTGEAVTDSGTPGNTDGYAVVVGDADAPLTMKFYEDPQCPVCQQFEAAVGDKVDAAIADGKVKVEYHIVSFLDERGSKNEYSSRAANALYVVADTAGPDVFAKYHALLYDHQPPEGTAGPDDDQLIEWAVDAGADEDAVRQGIEDKVYAQFVTNATDQMSKDGVNGTPGVFIDDELQPNPGTAVNAVLEAVQ
jgi:protein-disulfide isomerase